MRGSGCNAPKSADRFLKSSDGFFKASEGFPTPVRSPLSPPTPPAAQIRQYSWCKCVKKEVCLYIRILEPLKIREEGEEVKFKCLGSTNCDGIVSDIIITEPDSDVIIRDVEVNKPIARKRYEQKHSFVSKKGFLKSSLRVCSRTFTRVALMLAIIISILGGVFNLKLPEQISTIGTSSSLSRSSVLAEPPISTRYHGYSTRTPPTFARDVLAGKRFDTYIFPSADFWASRIYYLDTYTVNLESDDNFTVFYDLVFIYNIYIYILFTVCGHPVTGQPTQVLFYILWFIFL